MYVTRQNIHEAKEWKVEGLVIPYIVLNHCHGRFCNTVCNSAGLGSLYSVNDIPVFLKMVSMRHSGLRISETFVGIPVIEKDNR